MAGRRFTRVIEWFVGLSISVAWHGAATAAPLLGDIPERARSAGTFTVAVDDARAFGEPAPVLDDRQRDRFIRGRNHFHVRWVVFASPNGDWGLGPTYIADRCAACHVNGGRGIAPEHAHEALTSMLVRISLPDRTHPDGTRAHPHYGDQIQNRALQGAGLDDSVSDGPIPPEADVFIDWVEDRTTLGDGEIVALRSPRLRIENLRFGPLCDDVLTSLRGAQPVFGLGLLEAVPDQTLLDIAARQRAAGFDGRPNRVRDDASGSLVIGRFGWKANQPSLRQQTAAAALGDMGVTTSLYRMQNCPPIQTLCRAEVPGGDVDMIDSDWDETIFWLQALAVPARRHVDDPRFSEGERLFAQARCDTCHLPELRTADTFPEFPQAAGQTIRPYTDLLLHDMGDGLADGRPDFLAGPRDWRTPPLWGLGLTGIVSGGRVALLHDGRARSITEAILWHAGAAEASRDAFRRMTREQRLTLLFFLESI